jgi:epoxyqueuosine reductase
MDRQRIRDLTVDFTENSPTNRLQPRSTDKDALEKLSNYFFDHNFARNNYYGSKPNDPSEYDKLKSDETIGMRFFQVPVFSVGRADDPGFETIRQPGVVGPHHRMPADWLPGAKSVISFFLPFDERIRRSNTLDPAVPSDEWLFGRVDGQQHLYSLGAAVCAAFAEEGYRAVCPQTDDRYIMRVKPEETDRPIPYYSSNWSERHVGYVTGLGTFGLSTDFISKAGSCGRLISVVTDWDTAADEKDYGHWLDYCNRCGACLRRCPADCYVPAARKKTIKSAARTSNGSARTKSPVTAAASACPASPARRSRSAISTKKILDKQFSLSKRRKADHLGLPSFFLPLRSSFLRMLV